MEDKMEYEDAPLHHLNTWANVRGMITWGAIIITLVLLTMAATLTP